MDYINKNTRIIFLLISIITLVFLHRLLTSSWLPTDSDTTFVFQNLVLMIILGSLIIESKFTKPADALVNSLAVIITLISIKKPIRFISWKINLSFAVAIFLFSIVSIILAEENESRNTVKNKIARSSYVLSTFFGRSNLIFSVTFLLSIFSFYTSQQRDFLILLCFWAFIVIAQPIGLLYLIQRIFSLKKETFLEGGKIISVTLPGFLRYEPYKDIQAKIGDFVILKQPDIKLLVITDSYSLNEKTLTQAVIVKSLLEKDWRGAPLYNDKIYHVGTIDNLCNVF